MPNALDGGGGGGRQPARGNPFQALLRALQPIARVVVRAVQQTAQAVQQYVQTRMGQGGGSPQGGGGGSPAGGTQGGQGGAAQTTPPQQPRSPEFEDDTPDIPRTGRTTRTRVNEYDRSTPTRTTVADLVAAAAGNPLAQAVLIALRHENVPPILSAVSWLSRFARYGWNEEETQQALEVFTNWTQSQRVQQISNETQPETGAWLTSEAWQLYRAGERNPFVTREFEGDNLVEFVRRLFNDPTMNTEDTWPYVMTIANVNDLDGFLVYPDQPLLVPNINSRQRSSSGEQDGPTPLWTRVSRELMAHLAYVNATRMYSETQSYNELTSRRDDLTEQDMIVAALTTFHETSEGAYGTGITRMFPWPVFNRAGILQDRPGEIIGSPLHWNYYGVANLIAMETGFVIPSAENLNNTQLATYYEELEAAMSEAHDRLFQTNTRYQAVWTLVEEEARRFEEDEPDPTLGSTGVIASNTVPVAGATSDYSAFDIFRAIADSLGIASTVRNPNLRYQATGLRLEANNVASVTTFRFVEWGNPLMQP